MAYNQMENKEEGLTKEEAELRLTKFGKNDLKREKKINPLKILIEQFTSPLIILLIGAVIILGIIAHMSSSTNYIDIILIIAIVLISGISGFIQNYKAEKSIESLQEMSNPKAKVIRDGKLMIISSSYVVPGDVLILEAGDMVPADAKILDATSAQINESILTGESAAVIKKQGNGIYMNTFLVSGRITARAINTGMKTKIGAIAHELESIKEEKTPFYIEMNNLSKKLFWIVIVIAFSIAILGLFRYSVSNSILGAIALAVAAIPEGLPAVLVLSLAAASKVMLKKNALVRKLGVIESIGSVNFICADKTGTITKNEMTVTKIFCNNEIYKYKEFNPKKIEPIILCGVLNNDSKEIFDKQRKVIGDETEIALREFGKLMGHDKEMLDKKYKRIFEIPFDSKRKMMGVVIKDNGKNILYTKGAPENILDKCTKILINKKVLPLGIKQKRMIIDTVNDFASNGLRVFGFAYKNSARELKADILEKELIFIGLVGLSDPPRDGVKEAIQTCSNAGINVLMMTGDNPITAKSIANQVNIKTTKVLCGKDIDIISDSRLYKDIISGCKVFARLTPEHKLRIMTVLQKNKNIVAMTGDGVNDALALKKADVGIAMGIRGTDVAKQASDLVLLDDNFVTIVSAVKEGRRVFDNIKKFTNYLLTSNFAEVAVIFIATLLLTLNQPILLPIELLWINLLTDGFPALALGVDPARPDIMNKPPRKKSESVIDKKLMWLTGAIGLKKTIILFATFFLAWYFTQNSIIARTTIFTGFVLYEFVRIGVIRHQEKLGWFSNKLLVFALAMSVALQIAIIYTPLNSVFGIAPMHWISWTILIAGILLGYFTAILITNFITKHVSD